MTAYAATTAALIDLVKVAAKSRLARARMVRSSTRPWARNTS